MSKYYFVQTPHTSTNSGSKPDNKRLQHFSKKSYFPQSTSIKKESKHV